MSVDRAESRVSPRVRDDRYVGWETVICSDTELTVRVRLQTDSSQLPGKVACLSGTVGNG